MAVVLTPASFGPGRLGRHTTVTSITIPLIAGGVQTTCGGCGSARSCPRLISPTGRSRRTNSSTRAWNRLRLIVRDIGTGEARFVRFS